MSDDRKHRPGEPDVFASAHRRRLALARLLALLAVLLVVVGIAVFW